ncbi:MAG: amidohydrolase family protein, partial [Myxococcales bacterium]|nr:amidohydrolase family protein [Myxococcales bacterium]
MRGLVPCLACASAGTPSGQAASPASSTAGYLATPLPAIADPERCALPAGLPPVVDAHVHLFPPRLNEALWRWFDTWAWPVRYRLHAEEVIGFLEARGVERMVALHYAHKPGIAESLNDFVAALAADHPKVVGTATVMPGEPDAVGILERAFDKGLRGVKLHCHVQCFAPDDEALHDVYACCVRHDAPLVIHAGREPKSPGYACDPHTLCAAERIDRVLRDYPGLRVCVPHLGADE